MRLTGGRVFDRRAGFTARELCFDGPTLEKSAGGPVRDVSGCWVIPGLTDLHFHGCVGSDISDHDLEGIRTMAAYELKSGITAICPATINLARELGIEKAHGQITEGALSNLLILDQDLNIKDIIFKGQVLSL